MEKIEVLKVNINNISLDHALKIVKQKFIKDALNIIYTPNPEILLYSYQRVGYRDVLNRSNLSLPDGFGLKLCTNISHTVKGSDFAESILKLANEKKLTVLCVVRKDGLSSLEQVKKATCEKAPDALIKVIAVQKDSSTDNYKEEINMMSPDIILVGLGFPEQEIWIDNIASKMENTKIIMAVGGTFDFWTKAILRAPSIFRNNGLEWLWRLIKQPKRIVRIFNAVVRFPLIILIDKFKNNHDKEDTN